MDPAVALVLRTAFRHAISEPNAESGFDRIRELSGNDLDNAALARAVAACVSDGYARDPVRLPPGALQCHWSLQLTPKGLDAARLGVANGTD